jgi:hypothetical protein
MKPRLLALLFTTVLATTNASAGLITLNATNSGTYAGSGDSYDGNYSVGWFSGQFADEFRNFFVFDLSSVSGTITSATLRLSSYDPPSSGYVSNDPTETFSLFNVSTPLANLINGSGGVAAFTDLGSGTLFGSSVINDQLDFENISLNAAGLAFLQSNLGANQIAFGGAVTSLVKGNSPEALFNATTGQLTRQLILTTEDAAPGGSSVPEPSTLLLAGLALITLSAAKRKKA